MGSAQIDSVAFAVYFEGKGKSSIELLWYPENHGMIIMLKFYRKG
jgi:hypothetical protein